ncbi:FadR/GntR family transcriptional regulator [Alkalihalobacterium alkalinitrilicum]|uniref:FadR/GntR family transcriptional regulator n=1 Tax=Alkalihalobacterium alkalinitrilicum TaxID=427920 RepID=UPI000994E236|nr:FadR/GntR family transcriptional regulator [Alkalihalobacterium alkalinitrilicum]
MAIREVKPKKIYEIVAEQLLDMIKQGEVKPGERLASVQQLAEEFNVGRSAIREALSALKAMGYIEMRQGEGTFVNKVDIDLIGNIIPGVQLMQKEDMRELFEIRKVIETGAASLAAVNRTDGDLQMMEETLREMKQAEGNGSIGEKADVDFHKAIVNATKNEMLTKLVSQVSDVMHQSMREARKLLLYSEQKKMNQLYEDHRLIYEAIKAKDPQAAHEAMLEHIVGVEKGLFTNLKKDS